jgi:hypothetical protein
MASAPFTSDGAEATLAKCSMMPALWPDDASKACTGKTVPCLTDMSMLHTNQTEGLSSASTQVARRDFIGTTLIAAMLWKPPRSRIPCLP